MLIWYYRRLFMGGLLLASLILLCSCSSASASTAASVVRPAMKAGLPVPPWEPQAKGGKSGQSWLQRHKQNLILIKKRTVKLLFIGDSITDLWQSTGKVTWQASYLSQGAFDLGIAGDTTQNVLWRIDHGEIDGISPRVTVLLIGTNDISQWSSSAIAHGIGAVVSSIQTRLPTTKILLLGVFPRGASAKSPFRAKISAINAVIARLNNGTSIHYLDIGKQFLQPNGSISPRIMADGLHPTAQGYTIWARAMAPTLKSMAG